MTQVCSLGLKLWDDVGFSAHGTRVQPLGVSPRDLEWMGLSLPFAPLVCLQGVSLSSGMLGVDAAVVLPLLVVATLHHSCLGNGSSAVPLGGAHV